MKNCSKCNKTYSYSNFHAHKHSSDGYHSQCKTCYNQAKRKKYNDDSARHYQKQNEKRVRNRSFVNEYLTKHPCEQCKQTSIQTLELYGGPNVASMVQRCCSISTIEHALIKNKVRCASCRDKNVYDEYRIKSLVKRRLYRREYESNRIKNDHVFKLKRDISSLIRRSLNGKKSRASIWKYLPYTKEDLKKHLESLFEPWMNWNNKGLYSPDNWMDNDSSTWTWHIDHIIPNSKFSYASMNDKSFQDCWALSNLRPYSAKQNCLDGNRR